MECLQNRRQPLLRENYISGKDTNNRRYGMDPEISPKSFHTCESIGIKKMKLKITIAGPKVHDVGYRVFLLKHAMNMALPGLSTYNWEESGQQQVVALVEGDEARIEAFLKMIEKIGRSSPLSPG